jgi:hypothetical protein
MHAENEVMDHLAIFEVACALLPVYNEQQDFERINPNYWAHPKAEKRHNYLFPHESLMAFNNAVSSI